ncbi:hypothetical protein B9G39_17690 [Zooshikella ganghwensis]|uniref:Uncharacterized protein n=1 Tax=Zooshikella ganghwensis TaxID=202772 RepID=A0A4P9VSC6_9GAMM|nr:hypothetical protein B9G39_17690 [Zooshikella ganghwensis]
MTYCFLSGIENTIFWSKVVELRESTGRIDSFALAHEYKLVINTEILFYHFLFIIIAYSIASIAITRIVKKNIIFHLLVFVLVAEIAMKTFFLLLSPEEFFEYPYLLIAEVICAVTVCISTGVIAKKVSGQENN